jgi:hypothetical protein
VSLSRLRYRTGDSGVTRSRPFTQAIEPITTLARNTSWTSLSWLPAAQRLVGRRNLRKAGCLRALVEHAAKEGGNSILIAHGYVLRRPPARSNRKQAVTNMVYQLSVAPEIDWCAKRGKHMFT